MESLKKFKEFVDEINLENGRNYKISVLEKYKDDRDIKKYLQYVFDPFVVFGIAEKKYGKKLEVSSFDGAQFNSVFDLLDWLKINNTGKDEVLKQIYGFVTHNITIPYYLGKEEGIKLALLLKSIITKNLILGIDTKTINKVIPNLIQSFNIMLAEKYFDMKPDFLKGKEFALTTKIDGMRCIMMKENGNVTFWSRQGKQIEGLVDLKEEAKKYLLDDICLDGELVAAIDNPDTYKETMQKATTKSLEKHGLKMKVFDCLSVEEFKSQICKDRYKDRRNLLEKCIFAKNSIINPLGYTPVYFELLPILYRGTDTNKIMEFLTSETAKGEEGIMINLIDSPYEFKRSNVLLKVKLFADTEVKIIGFETGINKLSNTLGTLICEYKGNRLGVGSGFTDEERDYIWNHQEEFLGKFAKVKYFEETKNAEGKESLRFPIWLGIRLEEDK